MPATQVALTAKGKRIYHIFRNQTGEEVTPQIFIDELLTCYGTVNDCRDCGEVRTLCAGGFCLGCMSGATVAK
jgi:hypothetical protein